MECHCAHGWICEAHPDQAWPHDECPGPGMRCDNPDCPYWQGNDPDALDPPDWTSVTKAE